MPSTRFYSWNSYFFLFRTHTNTETNSWYENVWGACFHSYYVIYSLDYNVLISDCMNKTKIARKVRKKSYAAQAQAHTYVMMCGFNIFITSHNKVKKAKIYRCRIAKRENANHNQRYHHNSMWPTRISCKLEITEWQTANSVLAPYFVYCVLFWFLIVGACNLKRKRKSDCPK